MAGMTGGGKLRANATGTELVWEGRTRWSDVFRQSNNVSKGVQRIKETGDDIESSWFKSLTLGFLLEVVS
jgi:hypothetical protein